VGGVNKKSSALRGKDPDSGLRKREVGKRFLRLLFFDSEDLGHLDGHPQIGAEILRRFDAERVFRRLVFGEIGRFAADDKHGGASQLPEIVEDLLVRVADLKDEPVCVGGAEKELSQTPCECLEPSEVGAGVFFDTKNDQREDKLRIRGLGISPDGRVALEDAVKRLAGNGRLSLADDGDDLRFVLS